MAITAYTNERGGFEVAYGDALLMCVEDPGDPCLAAASSRIGNEIAASVLFTAPAVLR